MFLSEWYQKVDTDLNYRLFKHKFEFEQYLLNIPEQFLLYFISLEHAIIDSPLKRDGGKTFNFRKENVRYV